MNYQELFNLEPGALIKLSSEIYIWETRDWDGIQERNGIFLKHLGEGKHISWTGDPDRSPGNEFNKGITIGTTERGIHGIHVHIIQLFTDGNIITIEACPEFIQKIKCAGDSSSW